MTPRTPIMTCMAAPLTVVASQSNGRSARPVPLGGMRTSVVVVIAVATVMVAGVAAAGAAVTIVTTVAMTAVTTAVVTTAVAAVTMIVARPAVVPPRLAVVPRRPAAARLRPATTTTSTRSARSAMRVTATRGLVLSRLLAPARTPRSLLNLSVRSATMSATVGTTKLSYPV